MHLGAYTQPFFNTIYGCSNDELKREHESMDGEATGSGCLPVIFKYHSNSFADLWICFSCARPHKIQSGAFLKCKNGVPLKTIALACQREHPFSCLLLGLSMQVVVLYCLS